MMKRNTTLLFLLLLSFFSYAQKHVAEVHPGQYIIEERYLTSEISEIFLDFDQARLDDAYGMLPVYISRFPLNSSGLNIIAGFTDVSWHVLHDERLPFVTGIEHVKNEFGLETSVVFIDGKPYAELLIVPFRNVNGTSLEVIDSCRVGIEIIETTAAMVHPKNNFVQNSVLATGDWYRLATSETGIYKISYDDLLEMGIQPSSIDPHTIRIFGNGNGIVPEKNSDPRLDDLHENPIVVHGEDDGSFDQDDYILFYGQSAVCWKYLPFLGYGLFSHTINPYTDQTFYFLNFNQEEGKRVAVTDYSGLTPTSYVNEFTDYAVHENDAVNILKTGREWYGELFRDQTVYEYAFQFPNIVQDYPVSLMSNMAAHSTIESNFDFYYGNQHLMKVPISKILLGTTIYAWTATPDTIGFYPSQGDAVTIRVEYDKPASISQGWMNYVSLNARRKLIFTGPFMSFRDHLHFGPYAVSEYKVSAAGEGMAVWDVTDPFSITRLQGSFSNDNFIFRSPADEIREFIAFDGSGFNKAEFIEKVENQDLHAYDPATYIILTHPDFMQQAWRMLTLHQQLEGMSGFIVSPQEIYNEFSSGKQDPAAIRDFIRMLYEKADSANRPRYLLLLGDASYDYKDRLPNNTNLVPTYQSLEALKLGYSFVTDDFFGLLDDGEGVNAFGKSVEIGIGRFPVHTVEQASQMVDKIEAYMTMKPYVLDEWRNYISFIADDEDQNLHFNQAEKLQHMIDTGYRSYNRLKIYMDAFPQESGPSGSRYPGVTAAINDLMEKGSLIINYTGHGGEAGWAHEGVLDIPTINSWDNFDRLPLFITATCEFSRFDDPSLISAGEYVFLNPNGGGIGLLTTSRLAWADPNFRLNRAVYQFMFKKPGGEYYRLGDIVRLAKTDQNNGINIKNFVLLGDPALKLAYPECNVVTTSVNGKQTGFMPDTLTGMAQVSISGIIKDVYGDTLRDFNGLLYPSVFDKEVMMSTLGNDLGSLPAQFYVMGTKLHRGKVTVENGEFSFDLFMPQSTLINYGFGKISYYAYDTINYRDAHGYRKVTVGGANPDALADVTGPEMSLFMNNTDFVSGGLTGRDPVFLAYLFDEHGINSRGSAIGRDITLTLNGDSDSPVVLNNVFEPELDSYQAGWISYPFTDLPDGKHYLTLKAWDNMDNPSEKTIEFEVSVDRPVALTGVINYPNPFTDITYFVFDHNKPENSFKVELRIFNINGQLVRVITANTPAQGLTVTPLAWDGTDQGGNRLGHGMYVYRLHVTDEQGTVFVQTSKLIYTGRK